MSKADQTRTPVDLASIDLGSEASKGAVLELLHPIEGTPLGIKIRLLGAKSSEFKRAIDRAARQVAATRRGVVPGRVAEPTIEEIENRSARTLSAVTVSWEGVVWNGEPLECTPANAEMLYSQRPWIREQVDEFVGNALNFWTSTKPS